MATSIVSSGNGVGPYWFPKPLRVTLTRFSLLFFDEASWDKHDEGTLYVPDNEGNRHRTMITDWVAEGGSIDPYVAPPVFPTADAAMAAALGL